MDNFELEMKEIEEAFNRLVQSEAILTDDIKEKLNNAISGGVLPSQKDWNDYFNNNIRSLPSLLDFSHLYNLSCNQYEDLKKCTYLLENIQYETIKNKIGWGLLTESGIKAIYQSVEHGNSQGILEIGCGSGYWSQVLSTRLKKEVIACDINKRKDTPNAKYYDVMNISATDAIDKYPNHDVLMIWTDPGTVGMDVVSAMKPGRNLIVSGNIEVTGSLEFYHNLDVGFDIQSHKPAISFSGSKERTYILTKREVPKTEAENEKIFERQFVKIKDGISISNLFGKRKIK